MSSTRDFETAWHEAGHAVVGIHLGLVLRRVGLRVESGGEDYDGLCWFKRAPTKRLQYGVTYAAGPAADGMRGHSDDRWWDADFRGIEDLGFTKLERKILIAHATYLMSGPLAVPMQLVADCLCLRDLEGREVRELVRHGTPIDL